MASPLFKKVAVIGIGLMGGSMAMAIRKYSLAEEVVGVSQRPESLKKAMDKRAVDQALDDIPKAVQHADLVVLATPVDSIIKIFSTIAKHLKRGAIITDLGSAKVQIVEAAEKALPIPQFFVGSHPLVGSHQEGIDFAKAELFENAICIMTPTEQTNQMALKKIEHLWITLGCQVKYLSAERHDEILAFISHLPHLAAFGLMETVPPAFLEYTTQGLKDTTRIAASSPQVWNDICLSNARNILQALDNFVKNLSFIRNAIINRDDKALVQYFTKIREKRNLIK